MCTSYLIRVLVWTYQLNPLGADDRPHRSHLARRSRMIKIVIERGRLTAPVVVCY